MNMQLKYTEKLNLRSVIKNLHQSIQDYGDSHEPS